MHNNRKFDINSYKKNDERAKEAIINYLKESNYKDIESIENYSFDVTANKDNIFYLFEVEIKNQWIDVWDWRWKEIRIPERKQKLIDRWKGTWYYESKFIFTFVVFNTDCTQAWFIDATDVDQSFVGTIQNSKRIGSPHLKEPFFHIPIEQAELKKII